MSTSDIAAALYERVIIRGISFLTASRNQSHATGIGDVNQGVMKGFWGPVDSTMDWCEPNYTLTPYVAEFFNTLSSFPIFLWALIGAYLTYKYATKQKRFLFAYAAIGFVGLGSMAFHGTLRYHAQLLDELPMLIGNFIIFYCLLETPNEKPNKLRMWLFVIAGTIEVILYVVFEMYAVFLVSYLALVIFETFLALKYARRYGDKTSWLLITCVFLYYTGCCVWILENVLCDYVQSFHLHSWWHLLAGYGTYLFLTTLVYMRGIALKKNATISQECSTGFMHAVRWNEDKAV